MTEFCETCGDLEGPFVCCHDTLFCPACWADFGTERWKGIGSRMPTQQARDGQDGGTEK